MKNKEKLFDFLQKNYGWIVAGITGFTIGISFILRFIKYMYSAFYFSYYGLSYGLFNGDELNVLYNFTFSILTLLCFGSLMFCYIQLFNFKKKKIELGTVLFNVFLILISSIIIIASTNAKYSLLQFIINVILLIIIEIIMAVVFIKKQNKEKNRKNNPNDFANALKIVPFYLFLLLFIYLLSYGTEIKMNKEYRIINNHKVIVYTTNDYYLTLDCEIKNNELIIYKGKQTKIKNENVESELISFDEVRLK